MNKNVFLGLFLVGSLAFAQSPKQQKIKEYLQVSGAIGGSEKMVDYIFENYQKRYPKIPNAVWDEMRKKLDFNSFYEQKIIPIYEKNYTEQELDGAISFYKSPIGKSLVKKLPKVMEESLNVSREWGMEIAENLRPMIYKVVEQYYETTETLATPPPPPPAK